MPPRSVHEGQGRSLARARERLLSGLHFAYEFDGEDRLGRRFRAGQTDRPGGGGAPLRCVLRPRSAHERFRGAIFGRK